VNPIVPRTRARGSDHPLAADALAKCRVGLLVAGFFGLSSGLIFLVLPWAAWRVIDLGLVGQSAERLWQIAGLAGGALLALATLEGIRRMVFIRLGNWFESRLGGPLLAAVVGHGRAGGSGMAREALHDASRVRSFFTGPAILALFDAPIAIIAALAVMVIDPLLGAPALAGAIMVLLMAWYCHRAGAESRAAAEIGAREANRRADAAIGHTELIGAMGMLPDLVRRWYRQTAGSRRTEAAADRCTALFGASHKIVAIGLQVGLQVGAVAFFLNGRITLGAAAAVAILLHTAVVSAEGTIAAWRHAAAAGAALDRIRQRLAKLAPPRALLERPLPTGRLDVEQLSLSDGAANKILDNVSFTLEPGESLAIVGPGAAGKTTLARLLVGVAKAENGHVRLDGLDMTDREPVDRARTLGYLPQDIALCEGTARDNISRLGDGNPAAVIAAAQLAGSHETIMKLPQGYETSVRDGGAGLSLGERRAIALARTVYGDPRLVVLDEPDAGLDRAARDALGLAIARMKDSGMMVVVVTNSASVLRHVDRVLVLIEGRIQMIGARDAGAMLAEDGQGRPADGGKQPDGNT
jgi:PrtD family type I secretion system ABC transporter